MHSAHRLCRRFCHANANPWLPDGPVEHEVDFGEPREGGEARVILRVTDAPSARMSSSVRLSRRRYLPSTRFLFAVSGPASVITAS